MDTVWLVDVLVMLALLFTPLGLAYLLLGDRVDRFFERLPRLDPQRLTWKSVALLLLGGLPFFVVWVLIHMALSGQGYR